MTALHLAAIYGLKNFVKFLAKDFNAVNIKDIKGRIPLHYCAGEAYDCFSALWILYYFVIVMIIIKLNLLTMISSFSLQILICSLD